LSTKDLPAQPFFQTPGQRAVLARNRRLLEAAHGDLQQLEATLVGAASWLILTDVSRRDRARVPRLTLGAVR
jgi:hypothetical protein